MLCLFIPAATKVTIGWSLFLNLATPFLSGAESTQHHTALSRIKGSMSTPVFWMSFLKLFVVFWHVQSITPPDPN